MLHHYASFVGDAGREHTFLSSGNSKGANASDSTENIVFKNCLHKRLLRLIIFSQTPKVDSLAARFEDLLVLGLACNGSAHAGTRRGGACLQSERIERLSGLDISHVARRSSELVSDRKGPVVGSVVVGVEKIGPASRRSEARSNLKGR